MYKKSRQRLTSLSIIIFIVEMICISIISILLIFSKNSKTIILSIAALSVFSACITSIALYILGKLVMKYSVIQTKISCLVEEKQEIQKDSTETETLFCDNCKTTIPEYPCLYCGYSPELKSAPYWCGTCFYAGPYDGDCPKCGSCLKEINTTTSNY